MQLSLFRSDPPPEPEKETIPDPRTLMKKALLPHLPEKSIDFIIHWLLENKVQLRISRSRSSKLGDYRLPRPGTIPKISVNHNLNPFSFLITLVHEMAHHAVYASVETHDYASQQNYVSQLKFASLRKKRRPKPHGQEWKSEYRKLMVPFLNESIFPEKILSVLTDYFNNPRASSKADQHLSRMLKSFDEPNGKVILETLPIDSVFHLPNGRKFQKKEKIRTRYRCLCLKTKRLYLFNPLAEVFHC
jgi:SprT protein